MVAACDPDGDIYAGNAFEKLQEIQHEICEEQERFDLLRKLQSKGIFTRDIMAFVKTQAGLRSVNRGPDEPTGKRAMSAKITDSFRTIKTKHEQRKNIKKVCLRLLDGKRYKLRRLCKKTRDIADSQIIRSKKKEKYAKKIKHLQHIQ